MIILNPNLPFKAPAPIKELIEPVLWPLFYHTSIYTSVEFILVVVGVIVIPLLLWLLAMGIEALWYHGTKQVISSRKPAITDRL